MRKKCAVVVPIYKDEVSFTEYLSFNKCVEVFSNRDVYIVCPQKVDIKNYKKIADNVGVKLTCHVLNDKYFDSIEGYNDLCLTPSFYDLFKDYDYILIYQLDAYAFKDEIDYYINKNIDFIGAPVFKGFRGATELHYIGTMNGGFSLRNVEKCRSACAGSMHIKNIIKLFHARIYGKRDILKIFAYKAKIINHKPLHWEDMFFCLAAPHIVQNFKLGTLEDSYRFSFDCLPEQLFKLNNGNLPMGCHKFEHNKNWQFWKKYIVK